MKNYKKLQEKLYLELIKETLNEAGWWSGLKQKVGANPANKNEQMNIGSHIKYILKKIQEIKQKPIITPADYQYNFLPVSQTIQAAGINLNTLRNLSPTSTQGMNAQKQLDKALQKIHQYYGLGGTEGGLYDRYVNGSKALKELASLLSQLSTELKQVKQNTELVDQAAQQFNTIAENLIRWQTTFYNAMEGNYQQDKYWDGQDKQAQYLMHQLFDKLEQYCQQLLQSKIAMNMEQGVQ